MVSIKGFIYTCTGMSRGAGGINYFTGAYTLMLNMHTPWTSVRNYISNLNLIILALFMLECYTGVVAYVSRLEEEVIYIFMMLCMAF